jgi:hypothetical protein
MTWMWKVCSKQNIIFYDDGVSDIRHDAWTKLVTEWQHVLFSGKPGLSIVLKDLSNPLEYSELFNTPKIAEVISRETNCYAQTFLKNMTNLRCSVYLWMNIKWIMELLAFLLLWELYKKQDNGSNFSRRKMLETPIFWELFSERRLHLVFRFLHFADSVSYYEATSICINAKFRSV